jgi:transcriptional regulator GlxA family with amidase domain
VAVQPQSIEILPTLWQTGRVLRTVAALVLPGVSPFELGVVCEVFGIDRSDQGAPRVDLRVVTPSPGLVPTSQAFGLQVEHGLDAAASADLVAVPAHPKDGDVPQPVVDLLRGTVERGARVLSVCSGAFVLGAAGLLDGRRCTTHWMNTEELAERYPKALVDPNKLFVEDGPVITSAGTAAGIDACLHLVRREHGTRAATAIARRMVVPPQRDGGQAQFVEAPVVAATADSLAPLLDVVLAELDRPWDVDALAARAHLSPRTFARRFRAETGTTPAAWLTGQRLLLAQQLLEESDLPVEQVAERTGFGTAAVLRHHFTRQLSTTPQAYRRAFGAPRAATA